MSRVTRAAEAAALYAATDPDQRVVMNGLDWWRYETMLAVRGDRSIPRMTYLEGQLELISPSRSHESIKKLLGRLLEAYAEEKGFVLEGLGSMTLRNPGAERGAEPDECYAVGKVKEHPDLALEVISTHGGLDKLNVYSGLGVREIWIWENGKLRVHALRGQRYEEITASELLPEVDLALLARLAAAESQTEGVRELRSILRGVRT